MTALAQRRCQNHMDREAAARCPECKGFFCRECISEHDDRVICAACLIRLAAPSVRPVRNFEGISLFLQGIVAFAIIWFFFFLIGRGLLAIPAPFHEGRIWQTEESE